LRLLPPPRNTRHSWRSAEKNSTIGVRRNKRSNKKLETARGLILNSKLASSKKTATRKT
jgi:hypothetical protein